jgi:hypothetical protein
MHKIYSYRINEWVAAYPLGNTGLGGGVGLPIVLAGNVLPAPGTPIGRCKLRFPMVLAIFKEEIRGEK